MRIIPSMNDSSHISLAGRSARRWRGRPGLGQLGVGLALIGVLEAILFASVGGLLPAGWAASIGTQVRIHITPWAWSAYLMVLLGLLARLDGHSWLRRFANRFWVCWLWSVPAWCYFDWLNFYFMRDPATGLHAWNYQGMPTNPWDRGLGYLLAFAAIAPGMFLTAEVFMRLGLKRVKSGGVRIARPLQIITFILGAGLFLWPFIFQSSIANLAIWVSAIFLLDPINFWSGRPSIIGDWRRGRWGRTFSLMLGGLWCGLLWEFWNYWAIAKWTYHLPFLGIWRHIRYFQMPVPGLIGFAGFGVEVWVMWQFSLLALGGLVEGERKDLPADVRVARDGCI